LKTFKVRRQIFLRPLLMTFVPFVDGFQHSSTSSSSSLSQHLYYGAVQAEASYVKPTCCLLQQYWRYIAAMHTC
jgi:hypothetical protein